jgi:glycosyltransferase involved in cell wall biosynthesis
MKARLVILTEIIAPYRIPVFNALALHPEIELRVIFLAKTDPTTRSWRIYSDEIRFLYTVLPSFRARVGRYNLLLNRGVARALKSAAPDIVLCGGYNYAASWRAQVWSRRARIPFFLWCESTGNDVRNRRRPIEWLKTKFVHTCDGFVVPGTSAAQYLTHIGAPCERIFFAPNAVDIGLFAAHANAAKANAASVRVELRLPQRYFLFVGRLIREKGVLDLLEAYRLLSPDLQAEVGLVYVGNGSMRAELQNRARTISAGKVLFPGFAHRDELAGYYALADCLVFPTHSDTWGMVLNEAIACGLPVISSSAAGGAADLVGSNGITVPTRDVQCLAQAMEYLASNPAVRDQMSSESSRIAEKYSPKLCARGIAEAALACLTPRRAPVNVECTEQAQASHPAIL